MFRSLRTRLFLVMLVIVLVFVATTAFFASRLTMDEFQHYLEYNDTAHQQQVNAVLVDLLQSHYVEHRTWDNVQPLLDQLGEVTNTRILLLRQDGRIIEDTARQSLGRIVSFNRLSRETFIFVDSVRVGAVLVYGSPWITPSPEPNTMTFVSSVNRSLLLAVVVVGGAALLITLILARRISRPLERLTQAVRSLQEGEFRHRIAVPSIAVQSNDEIGELTRAFNGMADSLAKLEQMRRNLISDVAHELRTPLSCILGYLEALQDGITTPTPDLIASLYEEATLLRRLVVDLQELALADSGQLRLERQSILLPSLVEQAVSIFQPHAANNGLMICVDMPPDLPPVYADGERIGQVLRNLLNNAITYTPERGVITIRAVETNMQIRVTVSDTGIGIEPEHLPSLFDRFYRADRSRSASTGGAGLGLAIVKNLIQAHGGNVWAESQPGKGTDFIFTIPVAS